ncbi:MAG: hypothetical protein VCC04_05840, partial [Myxococcota bacterium]
MATTFEYDRLVVCIERLHALLYGEIGVAWQGVEPLVGKCPREPAGENPMSSQTMQRGQSPD